VSASEFCHETSPLDTLIIGARYWRFLRAKYSTSNPHYAPSSKTNQTVPIGTLCWVGVNAMIKFVCDSCGKVKRPADLWILGLAAEAVGITAARREVNIISVWDRDRAVHPLAVHFCSEACKKKYIHRLFGKEAPVQTLVTTKTVRTKLAAKPLKAKKKVRSRKVVRRIA
jgi:hypothetical protein